MASPFRIFRKYQKTLLVVAGVILMFVFVIGDSLVAYLGGSRTPSDGYRDAGAVAVRWDGGSLTNRELDNLVMRRRITNAFLEGVEYAGLQASYQAGVDPRDLRVQIVRGPQTEQNVVLTKLLADAARDAGMRVSDEAIVNYLDELGRQHVSRDTMRAMLDQLPGGMRVPISYVMDALRDELLAHNYLTGHQYSFLTVTPEQFYEDWLRVNDRVVVEAAAMPVESFMVDVPEPTDAELTAFYDKYKYDEPAPHVILGTTELPSPTPGFRIPRKIDVQFIEADYDQFLSKVESEITEKEIAKYYEENKDPLFIKADTTLIDEVPANPQDDAATGKPAEEAESATSTEASSEPTAPATATGETETDTPQTTSGSEPGSPPGTNSPSETDDSGHTEPPAGETQSPADAPQTNSAPDQNDQSRLRTRTADGVFRLAAFAQEAESSDPSADTASSPAADTTNVSSEASDAAGTSGPTAEQPAGVSPVGSAPTATTAVTESPGGATTTNESESTATAATTSAASEKPKEFQQLDEVRDVIRRRLAEERVNEQLTNLMSQLQNQVNGEFTKYFGTRLEAEREQRPVPAPPSSLADLAPLAEQHGLQYGKTGSMTWLQMRHTPVGESGDIETKSPLFQILFASDDLDLYQPVSTQDVNANRYLATKTSDKPGRVPELSEVREEVVRAWKQQKAADLAQKHAESLAKKAQESKGPLADALASDPSVTVVRTDPFSRLTAGDVTDVGGQLQQQPFRLSEPDGIIAAGPDFMEEVFGLKDGEVGAVLNHDHSIAYVVRVAEHQLPPGELRSAYLSEANIWPGIGYMMNDHAQQSMRRLADDITSSAGLKWERDPDQPMQVAEETD